MLHITCMYQNWVVAFCIFVHLFRKSHSSFRVWILYDEFQCWFLSWPNRIVVCDWRVLITGNLARSWTVRKQTNKLCNLNFMVFVSIKTRWTTGYEHYSALSTKNKLKKWNGYPCFMTYLVIHSAKTNTLIGLNIIASKIIFKEIYYYSSLD